MEKVVKIIDEFKSQEKFVFITDVMLDFRVLEEVLVLFLVKLVKIFGFVSKDIISLIKFELNKIVFQLIKFVIVEIFKSNISFVELNYEE